MTDNPVTDNPVTDNPVTDNPVTDNPMTPVEGYRPQSDDHIHLVNINKRIEERILRSIDQMMEAGVFDKRWLSIARTQLEQGFMAYNRAIFQPKRISLPEDEQ